MGSGDATPALVGDKLFVFAREGNQEVTRCLDANTGKEVWKEAYEAPAVSGPDAAVHSGPRSSPAVAGGKIVTYGVRGALSCVVATASAGYPASPWTTAMMSRRYSSSGWRSTGVHAWSIRQRAVPVAVRRKG